MISRARLVDEMAVVLCAVAELNDDVACVRALLEAGFRAAVIERHLDIARALARQVRSDEGDLWITLAQQ